jgi:hypothetical protein
VLQAELPPEGEEAELKAERHAVKPSVLLVIGHVVSMKELRSPVEEEGIFRVPGSAR